MSLQATRELAAAVGVEPLALLRANRHKPWIVESGVLAFESLEPGEVLRHPSGGEIEIVRMAGVEVPRRALLGLGLADFQTLLQVPEFSSAWNEIQSQMQSEGGSDLQLAIDTAKGAFAEAYSGLTASGGALEGQYAAALTAAKNLVLAGNTVSGAVQHVEALLSAAQGADPKQAFQLFTGTLIGIAVSTGVLTAGIGAAIVTGIGAALSLMQQAGLFGSPPQGTQICRNLYFDPAPSIQVGCVGMTGAGADPNLGRIKPGSIYWRSFPKPSGGNANDVHWFDGSGAISWAGSASGPSYDWGSYPRQRLIDNAFPDYHYLNCETTIAGLADFQNAFRQAWTANKEYELNGLKSQPDYKVLDNLLRVWNRAHADATFLDVPPASKPWVAQPAQSGNPASFSPTLSGWGGCPANLPPLFQTLIEALLADPSASTPQSGNSIRIHTGARQSAAGPSVTTVVPGIPAPATQFVSGKTYVVSEAVPGADTNTGAALSGETVMAESEYIGFLGTELGFSTVQILWWGPTSSTDDPDGYLKTGWLATLFALGESLHAYGGKVLVLATYAGPGMAVPAGVAAFDVTGSMAPRQTVLAAPNLSTPAKVAIGTGAIAAAAGGGLWLAVGRPATWAAFQAAVGKLLDRLF